MKLPIILSLMIAALTIPTTLASEENTEAKPEKEATAEKEPEKPKKKRHRKNHKHHGEGGEHRGMAPSDPNDKKPFDEMNKTEASHHHAGPTEVPGKKMD